MAADIELYEDSDLVVAHNEPDRHVKVCYAIHYMKLPNSILENKSHSNLCFLKSEASELLREQMISTSLIHHDGNTLAKQQIKREADGR